MTLNELADLAPEELDAMLTHDMALLAAKMEADPKAMEGPLARLADLDKMCGKLDELLAMSA